MKEIRRKKKCCKDRPRCKRCPVVLKRLEQAGIAERVDRRTWRLQRTVRKAVIQAARG